jgi:hypothetical protein
LPERDVTASGSKKEGISFEEASRIGGACWVLEHTALGWRFPAGTTGSTIVATLKMTDGSPTLTSLTVSGALARGEAERVVRGHLAGTRECVEKAVIRGGTLILTLSVRPDGTVADAHLVTKPK